jgi:hypothetical protein
VLEVRVLGADDRVALAQRIAGRGRVELQRPVQRVAERDGRHGASLREVRDERRDALAHVASAHDLGRSGRQPLRQTEAQVALAPRGGEARRHRTDGIARDAPRRVCDDERSLGAGMHDDRELARRLRRLGAPAASTSTGPPRSSLTVAATRSTRQGAAGSASGPPGTPARSAATATRRPPCICQPISPTTAPARRPRSSACASAGASQIGTPRATSPSEPKSAERARVSTSLTP